MPLRGEVRRATRAAAIAVVVGTLASAGAFVWVERQVQAVHTAELARSGPAPWIALGAGLLLTGLVAVLLRGSVRRRSVERLINERTAALEGSDLRLGAVLDRMADGLVVIDGRGTVERFNRAAESIFGYAASEVIGRNVSMLMPEPQRSAHDGYLARYLETGEARVVGRARELVGRRRDGSTFPLELSVADTTVGRERGFVGVVRDIGARKRDDERLRDALADAESASRAKSEFLATMSHELRTPLNAIIGYTELLAEDAHERGDRTSVDDLEKVRAAGRHLLDLINDVLDLAKVEAGRMDVAVERVSLHDVVSEIGASIEPLAARGDNALLIDCPDGVGDIESDPMRVRQILYNLLSNAAKFTQHGRIGLTVERRAEDGVDGVHFRVWDTGVGMGETTISRLFEPFVRGESFLTRRTQGTGLGLALTRRLCDVLGGHVEVESEVGAGSSFTVWLPAALVRAPRADETDAALDARAVDVGGDG